MINAKVSDNLRRDKAMYVRGLSVNEFHNQLKDAGVTRAYIVYENGEFFLSHPILLAPIKAFLELSTAFAQHEAVFIGREDSIETLFFAFIHDTRRGLAQGGLRFWQYDTIAEVLFDGLRLAQGMTRKNALAGLWWGGGKGIIPLPPGLALPDELPPSAERRHLFEAYGRFVASLEGVYYTAEDVGTKTSDMDAILSQNRFTTCISSALGGSGNPSPFTARGVLRGMQAAWLFLTGNDSLRDVKVAVQGVGNVGQPLLELLDQAGANVWIADINEKAVQRIKADLPRLQVVSPDEIFDLDVDILSPCARGGVINAKTIPRLKVQLICGAANNILEDDNLDALRLHRRRITFVPDYICNRMGITNCADEWYGYLSEDIRLAADRVFPDTLRVLKHARNLSIPPTAAANELADSAASELHPMIGHRGRRIIDKLISSGWSENAVPQRQTELVFDFALDEPHIRMEWEREQHFRGNSPVVAAMPISAAYSPNLSSFLSPLVLDVRARAIELLTGKRPRRVLGADPGGLALQLAVERSLPCEREEVGRAKFIEICRDLYNRNDASIRSQLHYLGVGFDPQAWLDPMGEDGRQAVRQLFLALNDEGFIVREKRWSYRCPRCQTVMVSSDVKHSKLKTDYYYKISFKTPSGKNIEASTFFPELLLGAAAVAVSSGGPFGDLTGQRVKHPLSGIELPVISVPNLAADAEFLVPAHIPADEQILREYNFTDFPSVFDDNGTLSSPEYADYSLEIARQNILKWLGEDVAIINEQRTVDVNRCKRCESIVHLGQSKDLFLKANQAAESFRRAIELGDIRFSSPRWSKLVLDYLDRIEPWCISRQQWWGNEIPTSPYEVLSSWFSLVALSLQGAGWPDDVMPYPIDEVVVDPDYLIRWVVPSQLVALCLIGRPIFRYVEVVGTLQVTKRSLVERNDVADNAPDEERFLLRSIKRPMRRELGNVVEPQSLIRRFGADALRLGYLLSLGPQWASSVTVSEGQLRRARQSVLRFVSKLTGLTKLLRPPYFCGEPRLADHWIVAKIAVLCVEAKKAYLEYRLNTVAQLLIEAMEAFALYAKVTSNRRSEGSDLGAVLSTVATIVSQLNSVFSPVCPYLFEKLSTWVGEKYPEFKHLLVSEAWLSDLVTALSAQRGQKVEISSPDCNRLEVLRLGRTDLEQLAMVEISVTNKPSRGSATIVDRFLIVNTGPFALNGDDFAVANWYLSLHTKVQPEAD